MNITKAVRRLLHGSRHKLKSLGTIQNMQNKIGDRNQSHAIKNLGEQAETYFQILVAYNKNIKKPNEDLQKIELETMKKLIKKSNMKAWYLADFLHNIKNYRLTNQSTLLILEDWASALLKDAKQNNQLRLNLVPICQVLNFLVEQGRYNIWRENSEMIGKEVEKSKQNRGDLLTNLSYCDSIVGREYKEMDPEQLKGLNCKVFRFEQKILQGLLFKDEKLSNVEIDLKNKKRSMLEIEVQSLLRTLQIQFQRQVKIYNLFSVDFLLKPVRKEQQKVLQVLGSHHYTISGQLRGRDIMRALLLNKNYQVCFIHEKHLNQMKGVTDKLNYIQMIKSINSINWE